MGIPLAVVMNFFGNAGELEACINQGTGDDKFQFVIARVSGGDIGLTYGSGAIFGSADEAVEGAKKVLQGIRSVGLNVVKQNRLTLGLKPDVPLALTQEHIDRIVEELRKHGVARTREILAAKT